MIEKTQYFSILKQLHDVCRNNPTPSLTGMDAYNEIMNFLCLRHMSDNNEKDDLKTLYENYCTQEKIDEDTKNENYKKAKNKSGNEYNFYYEELSKKLLPRTINSKENNEIAFVKIMGKAINNLKVSVGRLTNLFYKEEGAEIGDGGKKAQKLINKIYEKGFLPLDTKGKFNLNLFPYDGIGEGYEKFMKDAGQEGGNAGQYFTNIQVVNYILKKIKVKPTDKVIDPFAGSGGFILPIKKLGVKNENIYAREHDDKIYKFLRFNSMIAELDVDKNIMKGDSFDYHDSLEPYENFFDIVVSNPPYGMSIDINLEGDEKKQKYWNVMKGVKKNTIKDSMGLSLYSIIKSLKSGGQSGIVTERGVLNNGTETNSWQKKLRKYLLENTSVKEILLLPKGIFSYTDFDTAIIIFEKGKKTDKIVFNEGYFKDEDKGKSNKIMHVKENILTISIKDIINKDWSLKYDDYVEKKELQCAENNYKILGEICEFIRGKALKIGDMISGTYGVIGGGVNLMEETHNIFNCEENKILMSNDGSYAGYFNKFNKKLFITSHCNYIKMKNNINVNENFLFYYLKIFQQKFITKEDDGGFQKGQAQPSINIPKMYREFKVPILPITHQEEIVLCIKKLFGSDYKELDKMVSKLKAYDLFSPLLSKNYDDFAKIYDLYKDVCNLEKVYGEREDHKRALIKKCFKTVKGVEKPLGEVCEIKRGKSLPKSNIISGIIPVISGCAKIINYHNISNYKSKNSIFMARVGSAGDVMTYNGDVYLTDLSFAIESKNIINKYLYYYLLNFNENVKKLCASNGPPNINTSILCNKLIIPIPSPEDQEKVVKMIEAIDKADSEYNKTIESIKKMIENIYTNIEMRCESNVINDNETEDKTDDDNDEQSNKSSKSSKSATSSDSKPEKPNNPIKKTAKSKDPEPEEETVLVGKVECIKVGNKYYKYTNSERGELYAITNDNGSVKLYKKPVVKKVEMDDDLNELEKELGNIPKMKAK